MTQIEEKIVYVDGKWMVVASKEVTVTTGETVTLNVSVGGDENLKPEYTCTSENPNIATVAVDADGKHVTITGVSAGNTQEQARNYTTGKYSYSGYSCHRQQLLSRCGGAIPV